MISPYVVDAGSKCVHGGKLYQRPYLWKKIALNVIGKFGDDDWLGVQGIRQSSSSKEWPVSYHGTEENSGKCIADEYYKLSKCKILHVEKEYIPLHQLQ